MTEITGKHGACLNASTGSDQALAFYQKYGAFDVLCSDPPWGSSNLKYFKQKADKNSVYGEADAQVTEMGLARRFGEIFEHHITDSAFILMGKNNSHQFEKTLAPHASDIRVITVKYWLTDKQGKTKNLATAREVHWICATKKGTFSNSFISQFYTLYGKQDRLQAVLNRAKANGNQSMIDPCSGFGRYLQVGIDNGFRVYGTEICPLRFETLSERIQGTYDPNAKTDYEKRA